MGKMKSLMEFKSFKIMLCVMVLVTMLFVKPQEEVHANPLAAVPVVGAGAVLVGGLAIAAGLNAFGQTGAADRVASGAQGVWDTTIDGFKKGVNSSIEFGKQVYQQGRDAVDSIYIKGSKMASDLKAYLIKKAVGLTVSMGAEVFNRTQGWDKDIDMSNKETQKATTSYPDMYVTNFNGIVISNAGTSKAFIVHMSDGKVFRVNQLDLRSTSKGMTLSFTSFDISDGVYGSGHADMYFPDFDYSNVHSIEAFSKTFVGRKSFSGEFMTSVNVVTNDYVNDIMARYNDVSGKVQEKWETMKDAGMVIPVSAVEALNPSLRYDAEAKTFVDKGTGVGVNTGDLTFPIPVIKEGKLTIPVPEVNAKTGAATGETIYTDVTTGTVVGNPTGSVSPPTTVPPVIPGDNTIHWEKLKMVPEVLTRKFPFSIPWDVQRAFESTFGGLTSTDLPTWHLDLGKGMQFDLAFPKVVEPWFPFTRNIVLIGFDIALIYAIRKWLGGAS
ncbi:hypothetical protein [Bacillus thuringiensis]|uniref:hypothetical protein n=1 Tax=Bacillus thuringiensis TaxID=1428 RepID=UPI003015C6A0